MAGFDASWLTLREPIDERARAARVTHRAIAWASDRACGTPLRVLDLGAGGGSNMRFLAGRLPRPQHWRLVDDDAGLLAEAVRRGLPADVSPDVTVETAVADLAHLDLLATVAGVHLVTGSALFDLASRQWCEALVAAVAAPERALLAAVTYDGRMAWEPAAPHDAFVVDLVNRHQRRDKGLGAALGPDAAGVLVNLLAASGARVTEAASDWRIGPHDAAAHRALLVMLAEAAREQAPADAAPIAAWLEARTTLCGESLLTVGHRDIFAEWEGEAARGSRRG